MRCEIGVGGAVITAIVSRLVVGRRPVSFYTVGDRLKARVFPNGWFGRSGVVVEFGHFVEGDCGFGFLHNVLCFSALNAGRSLEFAPGEGEQLGCIQGC